RVEHVVRRLYGVLRHAGYYRHRRRVRPAHPLPRRVEPGGFPRAVRGMQARRRGGGATPPAVGLLPFAFLDGARIRGCGGRAVRDPDGGGAVGPGGAVPRVRGRGAIRRMRGGGDVRSGPGACERRVVPAAAAAVLESPPLGIAFGECRAGCRSPATISAVR